MIRNRTTLPLTGTVSRTQANLDACSAFALEYAQAFLRALGSQSVSSSAVIRRALALYVVHLEGLEDHPQELRAVSRASRVSPMEKGSREQASERLQEATKAAARGTLPGSFSVLLCDPNRPDVEAVTERAEELAEEAIQQWRHQRRKKAKDHEANGQ